MRPTDCGGLGVLLGQTPAPNACVEAIVCAVRDVQVKWLFGIDGALFKYFSDNLSQR